MPKGTRNGPNIDFAISELYGGIRQQIIVFSAEIGARADWVAERLAALLSPQREGVLDHLSDMRGEAIGIRGALEPMALAVHAHLVEAPSTIEASPSPAKKRSNSKIRAYWAKKTPEERSAEMGRRMKKWKPKSKAKWAKHLTKSQKEELHRVYVARSNAKKRGLPLPPIPSFASSKKAKPTASTPQKRQSFPKAAQHNGTNGKAVLSPSEKDNKQRVYAERSKLRAQGVPADQLPPLPPKLAAPAV